MKVNAECEGNLLEMCGLFKYLTLKYFSHIQEINRNLEQKNNTFSRNFKE